MLRLEAVDAVFDAGLSLSEHGVDQSSQLVCGGFDGAGFGHSSRAGAMGCANEGVAGHLSSVGKVPDDLKENSDLWVSVVAPEPQATPKQAGPTAAGRRNSAKLAAL